MTAAGNPPPGWLTAGLPSAGLTCSIINRAGKSS